MDSENIEKTFPKTREKLNKYQILSIVLASIMVALAVGVGIYFISANSKKSDDKSEDTPTNIESWLTLEKYNSITVGMTYKQVFDTLGEGRRQAGSEAIDEGKYKYKISFVWEGNSGQVIVLKFKVEGFEKTKTVDQIAEGIVVNKYQVGLD